MTLPMNKPPGATQNSVTLTRIAIAMACGVPLIAATTSASCIPQWYMRTTGILLLLASAAATLGGLAGFLFGIPRSQQGDDTSGTTSPSSDSIRANTNLEQISDWLTKILVGVGLTQLTSIPDKFQQTTQFLAASVPYMLKPQAQILVGSIITFYMVAGFLFSFLWTRLFLGNAMRVADSQLSDLNAKIDELKQNNKNQTEELKKQEKADAEALSLIYHALHPGKGEALPATELLTEAIAKTSSPVKTTIYSQAAAFRKSVEEKNPDKLQRTIPIFQALIACDKEAKYHTNFGNLGLALQTLGQYAKAEEMLDRAIAIRNQEGIAGMLDYECGRAICRIMLNRAHADILSDLKAAAKEPVLNQFIKENEIINNWLTNNHEQID